MKITQQEKEQITKSAAAVVRIIRETGPGDSIPMNIFKKTECEITTAKMIQNFWDVVDRAGIPQGVFMSYVKTGLKHKFLIDDRGAVCCGGGAGYDFLTIPDDFNHRTELFLNDGKKKITRQKSKPSGQLALAGI